MPGLPPGRITKTALGAIAQGGFCLWEGVKVIRTEFINDDALDMVLSLLTPENRLACQVAIKTGLRIGDILNIRTEQLKQRMTIREAKTGKARRVYIPALLLSRLREQAGDLWVFPGRNPEKPRTRQAVWWDINRAQKALRLNRNIGTHTMRKVYAVRSYRRSGDLFAVQKALNHTDPAVTMIYAMADHLSVQRAREGGGRPSHP